MSFFGAAVAVVLLNGERAGVQGAYRTNGLPLHP